MMAFQQLVKGLNPEAVNCNNKDLLNTLSRLKTFVSTNPTWATQLLEHLAKPYEDNTTLGFYFAFLEDSKMVNAFLILLHQCISNINAAQLVLNLLKHRGRKENISLAMALIYLHPDIKKYFLSIIMTCLEHNSHLAHEVYELWMQQDEDGWSLAMFFARNKDDTTKELFSILLNIAVHQKKMHLLTQLLLQEDAGGWTFGIFTAFYQDLETIFSFLVNLSQLSQGNPISIIENVLAVLAKRNEDDYSFLHYTVSLHKSAQLTAEILLMLNRIFDSNHKLAKDILGIFLIPTESGENLQKMIESLGHIPLTNSTNEFIIKLQRSLFANLSPSLSQIDPSIKFSFQPKADEQEQKEDVAEINSSKQMSLSDLFLFGLL